MPRLRVPRKVALVLALLVAALAVPGIAQASSAQPAAPAASAARAAANGTAAASGSAATTAAAGGLCSVPGIGDIGGLVGLCSLGTSGLTGDLNSICSPSLPDPEPADSGIDAMVAPPANGKQPDTLYQEDGVAGDFWAATDLQCSDSTSLIGNEVAGVVFDAAKSLDRVTITIYQSAASNGILSWLSNVADKLITGLGNAIYFPYLAVVVIIGAIWLAWQGLIRKRGTRTIEGTVWMVVAASAAIFLIGNPGDVTGLGQGISNGISQTLNVAFAKLPSPGPSNCVPLQKGDPQARPTNFAYTAGNSVVDQNADELWTVLVCKPWLDGELGTDVYSTSGKPTVVNTYGRQLLWAQSIAINEKPTTSLLQAKQATYSGIAQSIKNNQPGVYPLFQGKQWTTRLEIAFGALFAALVAGVLILLISVTLILLKLSFLLLLIVGPFFLLIGTHPGFGRVIALRWVEMLIGVLLKQAAVALTLSVLLYCYALIMGTSDAVLPWALKILMIALVTVAAFIYRKPFTHLFSAVGYGVIGSRDRADQDLARAGGSFRDRTRTAATLTVPGVAAFRAARYARRNPVEAAGLALGAATAVGAVGGARAAAGAAAAAGTAGEGTAVRPVLTEETAAAAGAASGEATSSRAAVAARGRSRMPRDDGSSARTAPPLNLPSRAGGAAEPAAPTGGGVWPNRPAWRQAPGSARPAASRPAAAPSTPPARAPAPPRTSAPPRTPAPARVPAAPAPAAPAPPARQAPAPRTAPARPASAPRPAPPRPASAPRSGAQPPLRRPGSSPFWSGGGLGGSGSSGSGSSARPAESAGEPGESGSGSSAGPTEAGQSAPFWLRPRRRDQ
jgi:hypothetical protein